MKNQQMLSAVALVLGLGMMSAPTLAYDRGVTLDNQSSKTVEEFYGSNTGTQDWEEDVLGEDVLEPGEEVSIDFDDGTGYCMFDFKIVYSDGGEDFEERFNVCDYGTLTLTD